MNDFITDKQSREMIAELAEILPRALEWQVVAPPDSPLGFPADDVRRRRWDPVFTGGGIVGLLLTDPAAPPPSRTKDIDLVLEIASYAEFVGMDGLLRKAGFTQSWIDNMPVVAWQWKGVRVDFLPHRPMELMQSNRWFPFLMDESERVEVMNGKFAWRASAPCFVATKFEAFYNRGKGDFLLSKDIEDIVAVIDGRVEMLNEINVSSHDVRDFVSQSCRQLLADKRFMECLPQIVIDDQREAVVEDRLRKLSMAT
ncbi:MAG: hypothetical protein WCO57_07190 [Verrucomicrobiota bacterium]